MEEYPWYAAVTGRKLVQGDILNRCRVFLPPTTLADPDIPETDADLEFTWEERDVVVMSQTCDLVEGREKVDHVLLCPVWRRAELKTGHLASAKGMEDARKGNLPGFHVLATCGVPGIAEPEVRIVDFRRVYSLPLGFLREFASQAGPRCRLLPPYREHLAQAFARFFMRVGLPVDIPPFRSGTARGR